MVRILALALGIASLAAPAWADNNGIVQSPLMMRRAGPSCRPGNLGAEPGAGYRYQLGPCAGVDPGDTDGEMGRRRLPRRARDTEAGATERGPRSAPAR